MPNFPEEARAREGAPIEPAWAALEEWVDNYQAPNPGADWRTREWPDQTEFIPRRRVKPWPVFFRVLISGTKARVSPGVLNLETPRMGEDLLTLDGLDEAGEQTDRRPELEVYADKWGGPSRGTRRSFVCLRVLIDQEKGEPALEANPLEWLQVVHRPRLPAGFHVGGMPSSMEENGTEEVGLWPLAMLYWNREENGVSRVFPNCLHNIQYRFQLGSLVDEEADLRGPNRHWFFGIT